MSDRNTRRGNRVYVPDRERESIHMLMEKMPYHEWQAFVRCGGNDPEEIEDRNTWYVIKGEEDSYESEISNRLRESHYSDDESLTATSTIQRQNQVLVNKKRKVLACKLEGGRRCKNTKPSNLKISLDNGKEMKEELEKSRRRSNNSFPDRPEGKTRYEESIDQTVFVPKGYCTAAMSRGKAFCHDCMLKPCLMVRDKNAFDDMWCNLEIIHCRPSGYVERKLRGLAHSKMVQYFGQSYVDTVLTVDKIPACCDRMVSSYIDSDCESGDEPDGDDNDICGFLREVIEKSKQKRKRNKEKKKKSEKKAK